MSDGRILQYLRSIVRELMADTKYHGLYEYRAVGSSDTALDLLPVRAETGLPPLAGVPMRTGLAGAMSKVNDGASVLVAFVDGDSSRPVIISYGDPNDSEFEQVNTTLAGSSETLSTPGTESGRVVRYGDVIMMPVGTAGTPVGTVVLGAKVGDTPAPIGPIVASRVKA